MPLHDLPACERRAVRGLVHRRRGVVPIRVRRAGDLPVVRARHPHVLWPVRHPAHVPLQPHAGGGRRHRRLARRPADRPAEGSHAHELEAVVGSLPRRSTGLPRIADERERLTAGRLPTVVGPPAQPGRAARRPKAAARVAENGRSESENSREPPLCAWPDLCLCVARCDPRDPRGQLGGVPPDAVHAGLARAGHTFPSSTGAHGRATAFSAAAHGRLPPTTFPTRDRA